MEKHEPIYHYDKIRINFKKTKENLRSLISEEHQMELQRNCKWWTGIAAPSPKAKEWGYRAKIEATVPTRRFFEILSAYETALGAYSVSYIELTVDLFPKTQEEKNQLLSFLHKHTIRKYARRHFLYERDEDTRYKYNPDMTSDTTLYIGGRGLNSVKYVGYERISKPARLMGNSQSCLHREWRIPGATLIKRYTGISTIANLRDFSVRQWINEDEKKTIFGEINHDVHGRFLEGISRWVKLGPYDVRKGWTPVQVSRLFCRVYKIRSAGELLTHYREEIKKINRKRGRRNVGEKKILSLTPYKRKSFIKIIS